MERNSNMRVAKLTAWQPHYAVLVLILKSASLMSSLARSFTFLSSSATLFDCPYLREKIPVKY